MQKGRREASLHLVGSLKVKRILSWLQVVRFFGVLFFIYLNHNGPAILGFSPRNSACSSSWLTQHFCTTLVITPTCPKISVATQNECKTVVSVSTQFKLEEKRLPPFLSGMDAYILTVLLKTLCWWGGYQERRAPIQTTVPIHLHCHWRIKLWVSVSLGYFHWKELGFAQ